MRAARSGRPHHHGRSRGAGTDQAAQLGIGPARITLPMPQVSEDYNPGVLGPSLATVASANRFSRVAEGF
ncbi:hypothetical protein VARIO8X_90567 [Burkholderiales bacterium 8X]|nr:hypothetical protein VARIO8X_90567 [Burkholderiales bacterium 8X]